jgi:hypothetical protein
MLHNYFMLRGIASNLTTPRIYHVLTNSCIKPLNLFIFLFEYPLRFYCCLFSFNLWRFLLFLFTHLQYMRPRKCFNLKPLYIAIYRDVSACLCVLIIIHHLFKLAFMVSNEPFLPWYSFYFSTFFRH